MLYPIKLKPIYKNRIWGGNNIGQILNRSIPSKTNDIGEAWDIVDREDDQSVVENGLFAGKTLKELRTEQKNLFGIKADTSKPFPILVKILDAQEDLSLQIHPKEEDLKHLPAESASKTEFWYILSAKDNAKILNGLSETCTRDSLLQNLENNEELKKQINIYDSKKDDLFYIPSGTVHAIGAGNLILEIQQNSDTTFRLSDWNRYDIHGNKRALHITESIICLDFANQNLSTYEKVDPKSNKQVIDSPYFETTHNHITERIMADIPLDMAEILSVTQGCVKIESGREELILNIGDSVLLPAGLSCFIEPHNGTSASFLVTTPKA